MKLGEIIVAIPSLNKVLNSDLSLPVLNRAEKLADALERDVKFFNDEKEKIILKFNGVINNDELKIPPENVNDFNKSIMDLLNTDVDVEFKHLVINGDFENIRMSSLDKWQLKSFITIKFKEGDD